MTEYTLETLLQGVTEARITAGNARIRDITARVVAALYGIMRECDVKPVEFWAAIAWLARVGASGEIGLLTAGLGFDRLLDILSDERDAKTSVQHGTVRAIEGPLYVPDAPLYEHEARLDDGVDMDGEVLFFSGHVLTLDKTPIAGAIVDVWHASPKGGYSHFDPTLPKFAFRRRIVANAQGEYTFRTLMPAGYRVPVKGPTDELLSALGRHGWRPAHIHFMVSATGMDRLTTQINIPGDRYLHDDMAFATRDELIVTVNRSDDPAELRKLGLKLPFARIHWDFIMPKPMLEKRFRSESQAQAVTP